MQHRPEAIASIREVVAGSCGTRGRIQTAENHVEASAEDIALSVHAHPTLPEALKEAALAALGRAIHF